MRGPAVVTTLLLLVPLGATQLTDDVEWTVGDFVVAGALLLGALVGYQALAAPPS